MQTLTSVLSRGHRLTHDECSTINKGAKAVSPSWGASFGTSDTGDTWATIGALSGHVDASDAQDTYSISFTGDRQAVLWDLRGDQDLGEFPTVAEAVTAMQAHASAVRY